MYIPGLLLCIIASDGFSASSIGINRHHAAGPVELRRKKLGWPSTQNPCVNR